MKYKVLLSALLITAFSSTSFADFTIADALGNKSEEGGVSLTGTGSVDDIISLGGTNQYYFIRFQGSEINFNSASSLFTTSTAVQLGSSRYSMIIEGNSTLNFTGTGTLSLAGGKTNGGLIINSATTINVASNAGGIIVSKVCVNKAGVTFNLNQKNALRNSGNEKTLLCIVGKTMAMNITADQSYELDFRNGTTVNLNATNGANLIFDSINQVFGENYTATVNVMNDLTDGALLINENIIQSVDKENNNFVIGVSETSNHQTFTINGLSDKVEWTRDFEYNGEKYLRISAMTAAVPEPAEWAMIFGGIALGLAIYRKRK